MWVVGERRLAADGWSVGIVAHLRERYPADEAVGCQSNLGGYYLELTILA